MDRITLRELYRAPIVDRLPGHIEQTPEDAFADWHADRPARVRHIHPALESFSRRHRDGAHPIFPQVLLNFERQLGRVAAHFVLDLERVIDFGELPFIWELDVHHGTNDLNNVSFFHKADLSMSGTERHLRGCDLE